MKIQGLAVAIWAALIPCLYAESFTTNIIDGIQTNGGPQLTVGATGLYNFLLVTNAGKLTNGISIVGDASGADSNAAVVTGSNSVWHSTNNFFLGNTGALNQVSVLSGSTLSIQGVTTFGIDQASRSNVMLLEGQGSFLNAALALRVGLFGSENGLIIRQGARALTDLGIIGREETAHGNFALLDGPGSRWMLPTLTVGRAGSSNYLHVFNGATVTNNNSRIGQFASAGGNRALVSGSGSVWNTLTELTIGSNGPNSIVDVTDGARLASGVIAVGVGSSSNQLNVRNAIATDRFPGAAGMTIGVGSNAHFNVVTFDGPSARGTNDRTSVGLQGASNSLVILNGAQFTVGGASGAPGFFVGSDQFSHGNSVEISGASSRLVASCPFRLGGGGSGNQLLVDGASLSTFSALIGSACGANNNAALIRGVGAVWTNGFLDLGFCSSSNSLTITDGAHVLAGRITSSVQGGGQNKIEVSGSGSLLRTTDLVVGNSGVSNTLTVAQGGYVAGRRDQLGGSGSANVAFINGAGTVWSNVTLVVGDSGARNSLHIGDGASVQTGELTIGRLGNATQNAIELTGDGTRLSVSTNLNIGGVGDSNRFIVTGGARAEARNIYLGAGSATTPGAANSSDLNRLSVIGSNSFVMAEGNVVSEGSSNRLEVLDGAQLHSMGGGTIGGDSGSRNSVIVSGHGSAWLMTNELIVGQEALSSSLVISNSGSVRSQSGYIGVLGGLIGEGSICIYRVSGSSVRVTGHNSAWAIADSLVVGYNAILNSLLITNGGRVTARDVIIGVTHGGLLSRPGCEGMPGTPPFFNQIDIAGGKLDLDMNAVSTLEVRHGTLRLRSGVVNAGKLLMTNQWSRLELLGGSLFCSETLVDNQLPLTIGDGLHNALFQGLNITASHGVVVREHATLKSGGRITANVTNSGTLSPFAFATLAIAGNFVQQPTGKLLMDVASQEADLLSVSNVAVLSGELLLHRHADPPSTNVTIIAAAAVSGAFSNATNGARVKTTDNLGSYVVEYTPTSVVLRDYQPADLDGDMIEDAWATQYLGHSPLTPAEKSADEDNDGASNHEEFIAGTDPTDSNSVLRASISYIGGVASVSIPCEEGKLYGISWSADLLTWAEVSAEPTFSFPAPGVCRWTDDGQSSRGLNDPARFFRVSVGVQ